MRVGGAEVGVVTEIRCFGFVAKSNDGIGMDHFGRHTGIMYDFDLFTLFL